jgi:hypothetical protein
MNPSSCRIVSDRLSALLRPMIDAIEEAWPHYTDARQKQLLRQAHQALAALAELEEGDL